MNKLMTRIGVGTATLGLATMTIAFASAGAGATPVTAAGPTTTTTLGPPAQGTGVHKVAPKRTCSNLGRLSCSVWTVSMLPPVASTSRPTRS